MGNFKDFDLDLKISKADGKQSNADPLALTISNCTCGWFCTVSVDLCPTIGYDCDSLFSCGNPSCDCSPSDMTACRQIPQGKNDIVPYC